MSALIRPALVLFALMTLLTGMIYPLAVTAVAQLLFSARAEGSLIERNGTTVGSSLIGQSFTDPKYFRGRPSATSPTPYNAAASGGSNLGPLNPALLETVRGKIAELRAADPGNLGPVPVDLVTASASGLDPHLSVAGIQYQVGRVARARNIPVERLQALVASYTEGRMIGVFGEPRVNVVELNLALDALPGGTP